MRTPRPWLLGPTLLAALAGASLAAQAATPRLVILYATCTVSKQFLSPYAPMVAYTPNLEDFARESLVFTRHRTEAPQSGIAYASIFTGADADVHRVYAVPTRLRDDLELITEMFRDDGWDVFAWLAHGMADVGLNYAQGVPAEHAFETPLLAGDPVFERMLARLRSDPDYKAFVVTNFTVTHAPYRGHDLEGFCTRHPAECGARQDRQAFARRRALFRRHYLPLAFDFPNTSRRLGLDAAETNEVARTAELLYKADVAHLDQRFGAVLDAVRSAHLADDSVIVFTADHGEVLYRPTALFKWSHSLQLAPEALDVPLLVYAPGSRLPPGRHDLVTHSTDIVPTLADLAGVSVPASQVSGRDLAAAVRTPRSATPRPAFSHTTVLSPPLERASQAWALAHRAIPRIDPELMWVAARSGDLAFTLQRTNERFTMTVFDVEADAGQTHDLFDPDDPAHRAMRQRLDEYKARLVRGYRAHVGAAAPLPSTEQEERLRKLGYVE